LLLSGNRSAMAYLRRIGALDTFERLGAAVFPFCDLGSGERWALRPNRGPLPWWVFSAGRRVPGTRAQDYLAVRWLRDAAPDATVAECLDSGTPLYRRLWQPVAVAALNTAADAGAARLFWPVLSETLGRGAAACLPLLPRQGLSESLIDPAMAMLRASGAEIRLATRLRGIGLAADRVTVLDFDGAAIDLAAGDAVVLAVPPPVAARLVPDLVVPDDHAPIVNAHYRAAAPVEAPPFVGLIGGTAEWVFSKRGVISVTVSAADSLVDRPAEELAATLWRDVAQALGMTERPVPPWRIVKERRATFRATPMQLKRRPATTTRWNNLLLAGDYVDTGLPATIEGAIRSGLAAAKTVVRLPIARALGRRAVPGSTERSHGTRFAGDIRWRDEACLAR
jgi:squalene-associated FAD-dependent desaturase